MNAIKNILDRDGLVSYYPEFFTPEESDATNGWGNFVLLRMLSLRSA